MVDRVVNKDNGVKWKRPTHTLTIQVSFTRCSCLFLQDLRTSLHSLGITGGGVYKQKNRNFARLTFSRNDALKIYEIMYNDRHELYLKRKKVVFEQFMKLRA
jgi:hypothetical protein